jgi:hypothetical protein
MRRPYTGTANLAIYLKKAIEERNRKIYLEETLKNINFVENNNNEHQKGTEAKMDNKGTVEISAIRGLVGEQPQGDRIHQTISDVYDRGSNRAAKASGRAAWNKEQFLGELEVAARNSGTWIDDIHSIADEAISKGQENEVYVSSDKKKAVKVNNLSLLNAEHDFENFIDRLQSHNELFHNVPYKITGFTENSLGEVSVVLEQPYLPYEYATQQEIDGYLQKSGFRKEIISDGDSGWTNGEYEIWDAEPKNVLADKDGNLYFIDTVINSMPISSNQNTIEKEYNNIQTGNIEEDDSFDL